MKKELTVRQICLFIIAFVPITKLFLLPSALAETANEDMWISVIILFVSETLTALAVLYVSVKRDTDFFTLLAENFNKTTAKIIYLAYALFFLVKCFIPITEQKGYVELTLYETTPTMFTFLPFFAISAYFCMKELKVVGRIADLFFTITVIGILVMLFLSYDNADFLAVLPIGANGAGNIFKAAYRGINWFGDAAYMLFFMGYFKNTEKSALKVSLSYGAVALAVTAFMILFYCTFTSTSVRQLLALTELTKYRNVISNVGRLDYLCIFFILTSGVFSISMPLYFATTCIVKAFNLKKRTVTAIAINVAAFLIFAVFSKSYAVITNFIKDYGGIVTLIFGNLVPLCTLLLRRKNETL